MPSMDKSNALRHLFGALSFAVIICHNPAWFEDLFKLSFWLAIWGLYQGNARRRITASHLGRYNTNSMLNALSAGLGATL